MNAHPLILIIEDDQSIANFIDVALVTQGYKTVKARTGSSGVSLATSWNPDLILLDMGLPDLDGMDVMRQIQKFCSAPIIVVSARNHEHDKVLALDSGANDYIAKPFGVPELLARIRVALRHHAKLNNTIDTQEAVYRNRDLLIDFDRHQVTVRGEIVHLTPIEFEILSLLAAYQDKVMTHQMILQRIHGPQMQASDAQTLRVFISNIRRKLETNPADPEYIFTEVGVGYRLASDGSGEK